jgi:hypothetical protein
MWVNRLVLGDLSRRPTWWHDGGMSKPRIPKPKIAKKPRPISNRAETTAARFTVAGAVVDVLARGLAEHVQTHRTNADRH